MKKRDAVRIPRRGMSLVEIVVAAALISIMFTGIMGGFRYMLVLIAQTRAEAGALAVANEQIEYLRSLPYDAVGTVGGIPSGTIPQNATSTLNSLDYGVRTLIQYIDAPEDGEGIDDENSILADYKRAKVEVTWTVRELTRSLVLVTNLAPRGMETVAGGGTLRINVFDSHALPVSGASVRVQNATTNPAIDVTVNTNASGVALFPGAPAAGAYQLSVSKSGYSSDQTYSATTENPNPNPPHVAVIVGEVSTVSFAIDQLSSLALATVEAPHEVYEEDTFDDATQLASLSNTTVAGGALVLSGTAGSYAGNGTAYATTTIPVGLSGWESASWVMDVPVNTALRVSVYSVNASGTPTLVPDSDLAGNSGGFASTSISLAGLSPLTYPQLALGAVLETADPNVTPSLLSWRLTFIASDIPVPNIDVAIVGVKNIGTNGSGQSVLKYNEVHTTDASGEASIELEWDQYTLSIDGASEGYDIMEACPAIPLALPAGVASSTTLVLAPHTANSVRVTVITPSGTPIENADVRLSKSGYDEILETSACGQTFFNALESSSSYTLETSASGYETDILTDQTISGATTVTIQLTQS